MVQGGHQHKLVQTTPCPREGGEGGGADLDKATEPDGWLPVSRGSVLVQEGGEGGEGGGQQGSVTPAQLAMSAGELEQLRVLGEITA